jgi:hypothetical protein
MCTIKKLYFIQSIAYKPIYRDGQRCSNVNLLTQAPLSTKVTPLGIYLQWTDGEKP